MFIGITVLLKFQNTRKQKHMREKRVPRRACWHAEKQ